MLLLSSDKISINCACATAVSKLRRWYGKKRDTIYSCTMINTVKSVMLTCKNLSARYTVPFNTVFEFEKKVCISHLRKQNNAPFSVSIFAYDMFCYENAFSLCINIGMSHVCVTKTLHCLNQRIKIPSETMRACYENLFSLCINIIKSHLCVTKTLHCLNQGQLSPPAEKVPTLHCFLLRHIASFYRSDAIVTHLLLLWFGRLEAHQKLKQGPN